MVRLPGNAELVVMDVACIRIVEAAELAGQVEIADGAAEAVACGNRYVDCRPQQGFASAEAAVLADQGEVAQRPQPVVVVAAFERCLRVARGEGDQRPGE